MHQSTRSTRFENVPATSMRGYNLNQFATCPHANSIGVPTLQGLTTDSSQHSPLQGPRLTSTHQSSWDLGRMWTEWQGTTQLDLAEPVPLDVR